MNADGEAGIRDRGSGVRGKPKRRTRTRLIPEAFRPLWADSGQAGASGLGCDSPKAQPRVAALHQLSESGRPAGRPYKTCRAKPSALIRTRARRYRWRENSTFLLRLKEAVTERRAKSNADFKFEISKGQALKLARAEASLSKVGIAARRRVTASTSLTRPAGLRNFSAP